MNRQITCPNCDHSIEVPPEGGEHACPSCGSVLDVSGHRIVVVGRPSEAFRGEARYGVPPDEESVAG